MGNVCCQITNRLGSVQSSLNINELLQRESAVERELNKIPEEGVNQLQVRAQTWNKDSYELFDFENTNRINQTLLIEKESQFYLETGEIVVGPKSIDSVKLLHIDHRQGCFWVLPKIAKEDTKVWVVIKSINDGMGIQLCLNDTVRLGKLEMKLKELVFSSTQEEQQAFVHAESRQTMLSINTNENDEICRVCLQNNDEADNPKINPCACSGSSKYIHLQCLQQWITCKHNVQTQNQQVIAFFWSQMKCEICHQHFQRIIQYQGKSIDLVDYSKKQFKSYAVFELKRTMMKLEEQKHRITYILSLDNIETFKIGRNNDNHIKISDISVSRCHAKLNLINNQIFIQDNDAKFGTLLKLKKALPLVREMNQLQFQAGRTIFEFDHVNDGYLMQFRLQDYHKLF